MLYGRLLKSCCSLAWKIRNTIFHFVLLRMTLKTTESSVLSLTGTFATLLFTFSSYFKEREIRDFCPETCGGPSLADNFFLKVWWRLPHFLFILSFSIHAFRITFIQWYHTFIHLHSPRPLSISSLHLCSVGKNLSVVPSRESNSGLPSSKPTRYQLSHAAP